MLRAAVIAATICWSTAPASPPRENFTVIYFNPKMQERL